MSWKSGGLNAGLLSATFGLIFIIGCESTPKATTDATSTEPVATEPVEPAPEAPPEPTGMDMYAHGANPFTRDQVDKLEGGLKPLESVKTTPKER